ASPDPTGSEMPRKTIGIVEVARRAARAEGVAQATMTPTLLCKTSEIRPGSCANEPFGQRTSMDRFIPSVQPRCWSASRKALSIAGSGDTAPITATRQTLPVCCARAASGHEAAALPTIVMNSRRLMDYLSSQGLTLAYRWVGASLCIIARSAGPSRLRGPDSDISGTEIPQRSSLLPYGRHRAMKRREFLTLLGGASAWPLAARAQQQGERIRRVGVLMGFDADNPLAKGWLAGFTRGLAELGWTDGRNVRVDVRWAAGDSGRMRTFAKELVDLQSDVILSQTSPVTAALHQETRTIP